MKPAGITVFLVFVGVSLVDSIAGGHWWRSMFWIAMGAAFWGLERWGAAKRVGPAGRPGS